jgi:integrase/recombinase XerD
LFYYLFIYGYYISLWRNCGEIFKTNKNKAMEQPTATIFVNRRHQRKDGKCSIAIRVTSQRVKKYYNTGLAVDLEHFDKLMTAKRRSAEDSKLLARIKAFETKATIAINNLDGTFSFLRFEDLYLKNKDAPKNISGGFESYIFELKEADQISTAETYISAKNSFNDFKKNLKYTDITPTLLKKYQKWMENEGKSKTTISIYIRNLRTIFNRAKIDIALYPFRKKLGDKNKYQIPKPKNIKKALTLDEIGLLYNYEAEPESTHQRMLDYWLFFYLCNGMNVKDFCKLKHKNISKDRNSLTYIRAKTETTSEVPTAITVSLKPRAKEILKRWGQPSLNPDSFIFPHFSSTLTPTEQRRTVQQLVKTINKYVNRTAAAVGIDKNITTYVARHSFATVLRNSGANLSFISDALGHGTVKTTSGYLASFETDVIHSTTDALTDFPKTKANGK